jgi:hypothetical protein
MRDLIACQYGQPVNADAANDRLTAYIERLEAERDEWQAVARMLAGSGNKRLRYDPYLTDEQNAQAWLAWAQEQVRR